MTPLLLLLAVIQAPQGNTLHIEDARAASARMNDRTVRLFQHTGLMPVPALEKPGTYKLEYLDEKGAVLRSEDVVVVDAKFPSQNIVISKQLSELKPNEEEEQAMRAFRQSGSDVRQWSEPLGVPLDGCMTSPFGVRRLHNGKPTGDYHAGLDQRGAAGTPIHAITGGTVKVARMLQLRGGTVAIDHGQGLASIYMHMSKVGATGGAAVKAGDVIGYVGSTGRSTAPHLHWSLYANGVPVNPRQWVKVTPCAAAKKAPPRRKKR